MEADPDPLPLVLRGVPVDVAGRNTRRLELELQVLGVSAVDGEAQRGPALTAVQPGCDHVRHQGRHRFGEVVLAVVARDGADLGQVGVRGSEDPERRQEALGDQLLRGRGDDQVVEQPAETLRPGRRGKADEGQVWTGGHPTADHAEDVVRLVHDHEIALGELAAGEGLHACDLHGRAGLGHRVRCLDHPDVFDSLIPESPNGLVDERDGRHDEHHPLALAEGAVDDPGRQQRFARPGRSLQQRSLPPRGEAALEGQDAFGLVLAQRPHEATRRFGPAGRAPLAPSCVCARGG